MTFDYFNTSYLAFGDKLKKAFKSLGGLLDNGYKKADSLSAQLSFVGSYLNKNYQVANPNDEDDPCNCETIYKLLRNNPISNINILPYLLNTDESEQLKGIQVSLTFFNPTTDKLCTALGYSTTENKEITNGTCFLIPSVINNNFNGQLLFFDKNETKIVSANAVKLFDFEYIPEENNILLSNISGYIELKPGLYDRPYSTGRVVDVTDKYYRRALPSRKMLLVKTIDTSGDITITVTFKGDSNPTTMYSLHPNTGGKWSNYILPLYLNEGDIIDDNGGISRVYEVVYE